MRIRSFRNAKSAMNYAVSIVSLNGTNPIYAPRGGFFGFGPKPSVGVLIGMVASQAKVCASAAAKSGFLVSGLVRKGLTASWAVRHWNILCFIAVTTVTGGCSIASGNSSCAGWKAIRLDAASINGLTDADARAILAHNEFWAAMCGGRW